MTRPSLAAARYSTLDVLGHGGMGTVHRVRDHLLGRDVAQKRVHGGAGTALIDAARREFAILQSLEQPGVIRVHDIAMDGADLVFTMDAVIGPRLDAWLASEPPDGQVADVLDRVLSTLDAVHREGIVHGDVKPQNILLRHLDDGAPWPVLIDFGLARASTEVGPLEGGTRRFLAPELWGGAHGYGRPTPASDRFAVGRSFETWSSAPADGDPPRIRDARILASRLLAQEPMVRPHGRVQVPVLNRFRTIRCVDRFGVSACLDDAARLLEDATGLRIQAWTHADAPILARLLKARLEERGQSVWMVDVDSADQEAPLAFWRRLTDCLCPHAIEWPEASDDGALTENLWPEARRERVEAMAARVIVALRSQTELPTMILPNAERLPQADRHILLRALDAGALPRVAIVTARPAAELWAGIAGAGTGPLRDLTPAPLNPTELEAWTHSVGIGGALPAAVLRVLMARAGAGPWALAALMASWVQSGALTADGDHYAWANTVDLEITDGAVLDTLWETLIGGATRHERAALDTLVWLGGTASVSELGELAVLPASGFGLVHRTLATASGADVVLVPPVLARAPLDPKTLSPERGHALARWLAGHRRTPLRNEALGVLCAHLGDLDQAARAFAESALARENRGEPANAARLWHKAAEAAASRSGAAQAGGALDYSERAVRLAEIAADSVILDAGLALAASSAAVLGTPAATVRLRLLQARTALFRGQPRAVIEALKDLPEPDLTDPQRMEADLLLGTALIGRDDTEAAHALARATATADQLGDAHVVGKISNNLGNLHLSNGRFRQAEEAYARAAAAKAIIGDRRGERVAQTNRALAERAQLRFVAALGRAQAARDLAESLGDRRGEAAATTVLALLWLDVAVPSEAEREITRLSALPVLSSLARVDGLITRARWRLIRSTLPELLGREENATAIQLLEEALALAEQHNLGGAGREAAWLLVSARPNDPSEAAVNRVRAGATEPGLDASEAVPLTAADAWLTGLDGDLAAARVRAREALDGLPAALWAGTERALELLDRAARLTGDPQFGEEVFQHALRTAAGRLSEREGMLRAALAAPPDVDVGQVLAALGLPRPTDLARSLLESSAETMPPLLPIESPASPKAASRPAPAAGDPVLRALEAAINVPLVVQMRDALTRLVRTTDSSEAGAHLVTIDAKESMEVMAEVGRGDAARLKDMAVLAATRGRFLGLRQPPFVEALALRLARVEGRTAVLVLSLGSTATRTEAQLVEALHEPVSTLSLLALAELHRHDAEVTAERLATLRAEHAKSLAKKQDELTALRDELDASRVETALRFQYDKIVHQSAVMRKLLHTVDRVGPADVSVLVLGESGVGKELLARALHAVSQRANGPFIAENAGAVPHDLFESVFFGHVRGAFTGAAANQRGLIEAATGGTLFLDEIGELRSDHQAKLLRVIQERRFRPVGSPKEQDADFRLVCATNRDLAAMVREGTFREDLYYRVAVMTLELPPLRARREDIVPIAHRLLENQARRTGRATRLSPAAADRLAAFGWPGNVRELENELTRASILADGTIEPRHLSPAVRGGRAEAVRSQGAGAVAWDGESPLAELVGDLEQRVIRDAMSRLARKKSAVAKALGLSRPGLDMKLVRYNLALGSGRERELEGEKT